MPINSSCMLVFNIKKVRKLKEEPLKKEFEKHSQHGRSIAKESKPREGKAQRRRYRLLSSTILERLLHSFSFHLRIHTSPPLH